MCISSQTINISRSSLRKYSRLVLAGIHHQDNKCIPLLCWETFLLNVKIVDKFGNFGNLLKIINQNQNIDVDIFRRGWDGVLCVFNIYGVRPIITTSFSFFRTNIFSGCSRCSFMVDCVLIEREPYWGKDKWWRGGGGGSIIELAGHTVTTITIIQ